jgi:hypothetical protein
MSTSREIDGGLNAGDWEQVAWGVGAYTVSYWAHIETEGVEYKCWAGPVPVSWGTFPAGGGPVTLVVAGFGDIWFKSPVKTNFVLAPT